MRAVAVASFAMTLVACTSSSQGGGGSPSPTTTGSRIVVEGTWASAEGPHTALVYFVVSNRSDRADSLLGAASSVGGRAIVHEPTSSGGMRPVEGLPLPSGAELNFEPGSYDVELAGVTHRLRSGSVVRLTLRFEHAGDIEVTAGIR